MENSSSENLVVNESELPRIYSLFIDQMIRPRPVGENYNIYMLVIEYAISAFLEEARVIDPQDELGGSLPVRTSLPDELFKVVLAKSQPARISSSGMLREATASYYLKKIEGALNRCTPLFIPMFKMYKAILKSLKLDEKANKKVLQDIPSDEIQLYSIFLDEQGKEFGIDIDELKRPCYIRALDLYFKLLRQDDVSKREAWDCLIVPAAQSLRESETLCLRIVNQQFVDEPSLFGRIMKNEPVTIPKRSYGMSDLYFRKLGPFPLKLSFFSLNIPLANLLPECKAIATPVTLIDGIKQFFSLSLNNFAPFERFLRGIIEKVNVEPATLLSADPAEAMQSVLPFFEEAIMSLDNFLLQHEFRPLCTFSVSELSSVLQERIMNDLADTQLDIEASRVFDVVETFLITAEEQQLPLANFLLNESDFIESIKSKVIDQYAPQLITTQVDTFFDDGSFSSTQLSLIKAYLATNPKAPPFNIKDQDAYVEEIILLRDAIYIDVLKSVREEIIRYLNQLKPEHFQWSLVQEAKQPVLRCEIDIAAESLVSALYANLLLEDAESCQVELLAVANEAVMGIFKASDTIVPDDGSQLFCIDEEKSPVISLPLRWLDTDILAEDIDPLPLLEYFSVYVLQSLMRSGLSIISQIIVNPECSEELINEPLAVIASCMLSSEDYFGVLTRVWPAPEKRFFCFEALPIVQAIVRLTLRQSNPAFISIRKLKEAVSRQVEQIEQIKTFADSMLGRSKQIIEKPGFGIEGFANFVCTNLVTEKADFFELWPYLQQPLGSWLLSLSDETRGEQSKIIEEIKQAATKGGLTSDLRVALELIISAAQEAVFERIQFLRSTLACQPLATLDIGVQQGSTNYCLAREVLVSGQTDTRSPAVPAPRREACMRLSADSVSNKSLLAFFLELFFDKKVVSDPDIKSLFKFHIEQRCGELSEILEAPAVKYIQEPLVMHDILNTVIDTMPVLLDSEYFKKLFNEGKKERSVSQLFVQQFGFFGQEKACQSGLQEDIVAPKDNCAFM